MAGPRPDLPARFAARLQRGWDSRRGPTVLLLPLSWAYRAVVAARRQLYRLGVLPSSRLPVPVIVVGNLVAGGAGKTPAVIAIVALLVARGRRPGVVSRGYGRSDRAVREVGTASEPALVGDEPVLIARRARVPVMVGRDRVAAGHALLQAHPEVDVIVCDDGLQHLALERDLEVVVFDERGAGNGRLLPAGPLREPMPERPTGGRLILYNGSEATTPLPGFTGRRAISGVAPLEAWKRGEAPTAEALTALRGRDVVAAAGVARPGRFFAMLREHGLRLSELALPDHHDFATLPWPAGAADVVVTEKDAVKLAVGRPVGTRVWVAALDFTPEPAFEAALLGLLEALPDSPPSQRHGNTTA